jgi:NADPH-dependent curcumin reductase CurA
MARAWRLVSHPDGMPGPENFAFGDVALPPLTEGMVHVHNQWLSVDPYMRGRMNPGDSYIPPFVLNEPMEGTAVGTVVESRAPGLKPGDQVLHMLGWRDEAVGPAEAFEKLPDLGVPPESWLGMMHGNGATAYFGLLEAAKAKAGDVMFVSAAAGGVGSAVVQIGKVLGMTVVGSAGGAEKCDFVRSLGADAAIDYKSPGSLDDKLKAAAPDGIDVYFDNVGGDHLDAALFNAKYGARFSLCGMIEGYNSDAPTPMRHLLLAVQRGVTMQGFLLPAYFDRLGEFREVMAGWIREGKVRSCETVFDGLDRTLDAFLGLFSGANSGKMAVRV